MEGGRNFGSCVAYGRMPLGTPVASQYMGRAGQGRLGITMGQSLVAAFPSTTVLQTKIFSESVNLMHSGVKDRRDTDVVV